MTGPTQGRTLKLGILSGLEESGMEVVVLKCIDLTHNSDCEGSTPAPD